MLAQLLSELQDELWLTLDAVPGLDGMTAGRIVARTVADVKAALAAQDEPPKGEIVVIDAFGVGWTVQDILDHAG